VTAGSLTAAEIQLITKWVQDGAVP